MKFFAHILPWIQIVLSVLLGVLILLQRSDASLGSTFGGSDSSTMFQRRGAEKVLFNMAIIIAILFALSALAALIVSK
jgi:protein translocase SecG subunit